jgi:hypothetical protein
MFKLLNKFSRNYILTTNSSLINRNGSRKTITTETNGLEFSINKFNGVVISSDSIKQFMTNQNGNDNFEKVLSKMIINWSKENKNSIMIYLPMELSHLASVADKFGFEYHHAFKQQCALFKWLSTDIECKIPLYATHQLGVAGKPKTELKILIVS